MKKIKLSTRKGEVYALVDDEDFECLSRNKWNLLRGYAVVKFTDDSGKQVVIPMHSFLMNTYGQGVNGNYEVDHKDLNRLNNQKNNLRKATRSQNLANRRTPPTNTSGYKGVSWSKKEGKWIAKISINHKQIRIGCFLNKRDAALAYNRKAKELFGEFAYINRL